MTSPMARPDDGMEVGMAGQSDARMLCLRCVRSVSLLYYWTAMEDPRSDVEGTTGHEAILVHRGAERGDDFVTTAVIGLLAYVSADVAHHALGPGFAIEG